MPIHLVRSDVRLSEQDWLEPVANWDIPPRKDHAAELARLYNAPGTRVVCDVAGIVHHSPILCADGSVSIEGSSMSGAGGRIGGTVFRPMPTATPPGEMAAPLLTLGDGKYSPPVGTRIRNVMFRGYGGAGQAIVIAQAQNLELDGVQVIDFAEAVAIEAAGRVAGVVIRGLAVRGRRGVVIDAVGSAASSSASSTAGVAIENMTMVGGEIAIWSQRGARTMVIEGGVCEAQTVAGILIDSGLAEIRNWYGESGRVGGRKVPAIAVRGTAQVVARMCRFNGCFVDQAAGAALIQEHCHDAFRDAGSGQVLPIRLGELPTGFPAWQIGPPPAAAA